MKRAIIVVFLLALLSQIALAQTVSEIDDNHSLVKNESIQQYQETGIANASIEGMRLRVTIATEHEQVGLEGFPNIHSDVQNDYIRFDYDESISRTVRIYIPSAYFTPRRILDVKSVNGDATADFVPAKNGSMTAVSVNLKGQGDYVFKVSEEAGIVFSRVREYRQAMNETTGISIPSLFGGGAEWHYIDENKLAEDNTTYAIEKPEDETLMVQYDNAPEQSEEYWLAVPTCSGDSSIPVCTFTKDKQPNTKYVLVKITDPPTMRYKYGRDIGDSVRAAMRDASLIVDRAMSTFDKFFGGG